MTRAFVAVALSVAVLASGCASGKSRCDCCQIGPAQPYSTTYGSTQR